MLRSDKYSSGIRSIVIGSYYHECRIASTGLSRAALIAG